MLENQSDGLIHIDASTFQRPLEELAETLAQKVKREAPKILASPGINAPAFVALDLHVLVRQAMYTYNLLFYLNADERREADSGWRTAYGIVVLPVIRNMIDCLYNVTAILEDPREMGIRFAKSGFKKALMAVDDDEERYGGRPEWDEWIESAREGLGLGIRIHGLKIDEVLSTTDVWPTLGTYIGNKKRGGITSPHQDFLKTFLLGPWHEYSAMAHGAFDGLLPVSMYFMKDALLHEDREKVEAHYPRVLFKHIGRAAIILLCIVTELQGYFHFDGARIGERIHQIWNALMPGFEAKELYTERYAQFMKDKGINS